MNTRIYIIIFVIAFSLINVGCAHLPDANVRYHLAESKVSFKVVRTIACDSNNNIYISHIVTPDVVHRADTRDSATVVIPLIKLKGQYSDTDMKFVFYDDGRLKEFNATSTGQGDAILKTISTLPGILRSIHGEPRAFPKECAAIKKYAGDDPLVLIYHSAVDIRESMFNQDQIIPAIDISKVILENLGIESGIGLVCAQVVGKITSEPRTDYVKKTNDVLLELREPGLARIKVKAGGSNGCQKETIWDDTIIVAQFGTSYQLPIPKPTAFGKGTLGATFSESGSLTTVQFLGNTGAEQLLSGINSIGNATKGESIQEKLAATKAEADLIAQQQRLIRCLADPEKCI